MATDGRTDDEQRMARFAAAYETLRRADPDVAALAALGISFARQQYERAGLPFGESDHGCVSWFAQVLAALEQQQRPAPAPTRRIDG